MKEVFSAYQELLCLDATCTLLGLGFSTYLMLIDDSNDQKLIVAVLVGSGE